MVCGNSVQWAGSVYSRWSQYMVCGDSVQWAGLTHVHRSRISIVHFNSC